MKLIKKVSVVILVIALTAVYPAMAFADDNDQVPTTGNPELVKDQEGAGEGSGTQKSWKEARNLIMADRKEIQDEFGILGEEIEVLENELEDAEAENDSDLIESLKSKIEEKKSQMDNLKDDIIAKIEEMKTLMKSKYTDEELKQLEKVGQGLRESSDAVLPVENILTANDVKFDTPPVIKQGRTLIPVRAVAEGMGAVVTYNDEEQTVTIEKDDKTIVLKLDEGTVEVDGIAVDTDVPAEIMNNRTMVPLRFIAEQLGLKVQWEQETQTVEINE